MARILSTRLLPILLLALLAITVAQSEAKTCKNKKVNAVKHHKQHKQQSSSSSAPKPKATHHHKHKSASKKAATTPNRGKAGVAGGQSIPWVHDNLAWYYNWQPKPSAPKDSGLQKASMLWGLGKTSLASDNDAARFAQFKTITPGTYDYVIGFNEPDFQGDGSSGPISPQEGADAWEKYIAPHGRAGSILISPAMAKQRDENWLKPWLSKVQTKPDAIAVHIFQNDASKIGPVLDHFAQYGLPMWITEFACINYQDGAHQPCGQDDTNTYIAKAVAMFEADDRVAAYSVSDAYNGPYSALTPDHNGSKLSQTGNVFKQAVSKYISRRSVAARDAIDTSARMVRRSIAHRRHAARSHQEEDDE